LSFEQFDLLVVVEVDEDLFPQPRFGVLQHAPRFGGRQALHEFGHSGRMEGRAELPQFQLVAFRQVLAQLGQIERVDHGRATRGWAAKRTLRRRELGVYALAGEAGRAPGRNAVRARRRGGGAVR